MGPAVAQRGSLEGPQARLTGLTATVLICAAPRVHRVAEKLVVVVRTDLGMGRGKLAAQVAHAAVAAALAAQGSREFSAWLDEGQPKVVLSVSDADQLSEIAAAADAAGLPVHVIRDAGRTQLAPGTPTCCAVGPAETARVDTVTGGLSLL
jgi:PTH2 family peptidyl-tRNA hydrolase